MSIFGQAMDVQNDEDYVYDNSNCNLPKTFFQIVPKAIIVWRIWDIKHCLDFDVSIILIRSKFWLYGKTHVARS